MLMRLRFPELLDEHELTPYFLTKRSNGRISLSTAYRLRREKGRLKSFDADLLQAIVDVLGIEPAELLESEPAEQPPPKRARGKR
jgi:transcriptional regulator with XRE-family HTH domain